MNCSEHKEESVSRCGWCSAPICQKCLSWAHQKKICPRCFAKLSAQGVDFNKKKKSGIIQNKDPSLTPEKVEQAKNSMKPKNKEPLRIRNIPQHPSKR